MAGSTIWAPVGEQGPPGPEGPMGPQGPAGPAGPDTAAFAAQLANVANPAFGSALVGRSSQIVPTIAAIRALLKTSPSGYAEVRNDKIQSGYYYDSLDSISADDGGQTLVAGDGGRWKLANNGTIAVTQFESIQQAMSSTAKNLVFPAGTYNITANATWPTGKTYTFAQGAQLNVSGGVTLTIAGVVRGYYGQIFTGSGIVTGIRDVSVIWFGAGLGGANDSPAIQAAHDCSKGGLNSDGTDFVVRLVRNMTIASTITLLPTINFPLQFVGYNSAFACKFTLATVFTGSIAVLVNGNVDPTQGISDFVVSGFVIDRGANTTCTAGIQFGTGVTAKISGFKEALVSNVFVQGFPIGFNITDIRLIKFDRCTAWSDQLAGSIPCQVTVTSSTSFTGDIDFHNCQWVGHQTSGKGFTINNSINAAQIKGVRLHANIFYKGARFFEVYASAGGIIGDIWLNPGCQFDGVGQNMVWIEGTGAGTTIDSIHLSHVYMRGTSGDYQLRVAGAASARVSNIWVTDCWFANVNQLAVYFSGITSFNFDRNQFLDITNAAGPAALFDSCTRYSACNNILSRTGSQALTYFIQTGGTSNYYNICNNIGGGIVATAVVSDLGGGAQKTLTGNI